MDTYTNNTFAGYYPVGTAAVVIARNNIEASEALNAILLGKGLRPDVKPEDMVKMDAPLEAEAHVRILCDGDY